MQWTLREPAHVLTAALKELGLGWLESAHRWTGTTCWATSLDCSGRSEERDAGRARLDGVDGGDLRQTRPSWTTIQDVSLGFGNATSDRTGTIKIASIRYSPL